MTTITAEESRALLERETRYLSSTSTPVVFKHLRAALDREAIMLVQIGELAEQVGWLGNDLRRAEAERRERIATAILTGSTLQGWSDEEMARFAIRRADALIAALDAEAKGNA